MRAALYHRVSTLDQDKTTARDELRGAARQRKARVVLDVEEKGSGANNDRPGLQRILEAANAGKIDVVFVWKLDRWGRSVRDVLHNVELLKAAGVRFICTSQSLDVRPSGDAVSNLLLTLLGACAEFERDLIRERTRLGLARARKRGAAIGRPRVARPDVEAVRAVMLEREDERHKPPLEAVAKRVGCSMHALREVLPALRCGERRYSFDTSGRYGTCVRPGEVCACGANVCRMHAGSHQCGDVDKKKGTVSARASSSSTSRTRVTKGVRN